MEELLITSEIQPWCWKVHQDLPELKFSFEAAQIMIKLKNIPQAKGKSPLGTILLCCDILFKVKEHKMSNN